MEQVLVKVRDFAQRCGCTPQNVYGHLRTYAADLEGHTYQGKGRQGILLDDYAQEFLRSVMYPKDLSENVLQVQINELRGQLMQAETERMRLGSKLIQVEAERDRALIDAGQYQKLLTASQEAEQAKDAEIQELREKHNLALVKAREDVLYERQVAEQLQGELEAERAKQKALKEGSFFGKLKWAFSKEEA